MKTFSREGLSVSFFGPDLDEGPLPAVLYFALSAEDSLGLDPYNQPALALESFRLRVFSVTLPFHGADFSPLKAIGHWAEEMEKGNNIIDAFIDQVKTLVYLLIDENVILAGKLAVMGLSRGGLIAAHLASKVPEVSSILGFAPMTQLSFAKEFENIKARRDVLSLNLPSIASKIFSRRIRFYIGNRDVLVGTDLLFSLVSELTEMAYESHIRSPNIEMIISPSIGMKGHGTPPHVFREGALWIARELGVDR